MAIFLAFCTTIALDTTIGTTIGNSQELDLEPEFGHSALANNNSALDATTSYYFNFSELVQKKFNFNFSEHATAFQKFYFSEHATAFQSVVRNLYNYSHTTRDGSKSFSSKSEK